MKITIIGCGWLGFPLLESLVKAKHTVRGTSRSSERIEAINAAGGKGFRVDLPKNFFPPVFGGQDLLIITLPPGGRQLGDRAEKAYLAKLLPLGKLMAGENAPHVIYTSSTGVYGASIGSEGAASAGAVDETKAVSPVTHSSRAVVAAENWLAGQTDQLTIVRLAGLIGPDRHPGRFFGGRDRPVTQADAPVNLVHREDVIAAFHTLITAGLPAGIFNVCAAAHPAKGDFYAAAAREVGLKIAGTEAGGAGGKIISSEKLRGLGWKPEYDDLKTK